MEFNPQKIKKGFLILAWALYDLANQFFFLIVVSLYFVRWLTLEKNTPEIFFSLSFGISTFLVCFFSPVLGTISDITQRRRPFLVFLTLISVFFTLILGLSDVILLNLCFFILANFGCQTAVVFYNALIVNVASEKRIGFVSGLGRVFGYSGAVLALYIIKPVVVKSGYQAAFFPAGILFLLFALPCMLFVKDRPPLQKINLSGFLKKEKIVEVFRNLKAIIFNPDESIGLADFLKAAFFGLCSVNVVILFMSIYATKVFGLNEVQIVNLVGFSAFFAILGSMFSGSISDYVGHKRSLIIIFILWMVCFLAAGLLKSVVLYWVIGALVGISLGATWVVSRALAVKLVAREKVGEVFGLFNMVGYLSSIVGAVYWGIITYLLSPLGQWGYRISLLSLISFMVLGVFFLLRIPDNKEKRI